MSRLVHPKIKGVLWLIAAFCLSAAAVFCFALGLRQIPRSLEARMGNALISFPPARICHRPESVLALKKLVSRIYPFNDQEKSLPISVEVLRGGPLNAFASLGPRIFVYETLIQKAQSADEVAGVLAHELGHVQERHVLDHLAFRVLMIPFWAMVGSNGAMDPSVLGVLAQMKYTREQEYDADVNGLERLKSAEIDVAALSRFFERLQGSSSVPAILSDHPSPESRAKLSLLYSIRDPKPVLNDAEWSSLRQICRD